jgi:NADH-quinone oxidoreductase subunit C
VSPAELAERLADRFPDQLTARGETTVIAEREDLVKALAYLRDEGDLAFDLLSSVTATDWPGREARSWVAYELFSTAHKHRLRVKVALPEDDAHLPSVVALWPTANWHEREVYDFFGIVFDGHPNLRRILLPDGWEGHPLRKTEELGGVNTRFKGAFIPPVDRRTS